MSHHTDMRGAEALADDLQRELVRAVDDLRGPETAEKAKGELIRNALIELIVATRRNDEFNRIVRTIAREVGLVAKGPLIRALLLRGQEEARQPVGAALLTELDDPEKTPVPGALAAAEIEVDVTPERGATRRVIGPWPDKRRGR